MAANLVTLVQEPTIGNNQNWDETMLLKNSGKLLLLAALIIYGNQTLYADDITESFKVQPGGELTIKSDLGTIEILTGKKNTVDIEISRELKLGVFGRQDIAVEDFHITIEQVSNGVKIVGDLPGKRGWGWRSPNLKVHFRVTVPKEYNVDLTTSGGSISVADLNGTANVNTSGGGIDLGMIAGTVNAETSGGSIKLAGSGQSSHLKTSGGSIEAGQVKGDLRASTSGGGIHIDEVGGLVSANTSGGSISVFISNQPDDDCRLSTSGGSITVYLADDIAIDLDASTSGGKVYVDMPILASGYLGNRSVHGSINGGGPELDVSTSGGSIRILNR